MPNQTPSADMRGRVVIITGGNSGIGLAAAREIAKRGATVVITARREMKGATALDIVRRYSGNDAAAVLPLDLSSFASIRTFAARMLAEYDRLDVLVNNAGGLLSKRQLTREGYEMTFGVNHLGHFLLTELLLDRLEFSAPSRIVNVSSIGHRLGAISFSDPMYEQRPYNPTEAYNQSKLANVLFTAELAKRLVGTGVTANSMHPGAVRTGFGSADDTQGFERMVMTIGRPFMISARRGSKTIVYLACSPDVASVSGEYFVRCKPHTPSKNARDPEAARRLWQLSDELVAERPPSPSPA
jgi:NAD(P)-dependent dehydrogenase (short-subunit alcohol dehydrogenase family)